MRKTTHALAIPVALLLAAGVAACGGETPVTTSTGSAQETSGGGAASTKPTASEGETASAMDLKVGDCFNQSSETTEVASVEVVSCDSPHVYEVYNNSDIDDSAYTAAPSSDELDNEIYDACHDAFETYVGISADSSSYGIASFQPTPGTWAHGDRTITCLITSKDHSPLTGSARDSKK